MKNDYLVIGVLLKESFNKEYTTKEYLFKSYDPVEIDDIVVVDTQFGLAIGIVNNIYNDDSINAKKQVVCRCDMTKFKERLYLEEQRKEIKRKIEKKAKSLQKLAIYETLAKEDDEMAELLKLYKGLS